VNKSTLSTTLLTLGVFFWGWSFVFIKESLNGTDVFSFIFSRFLLASVILAAVSLKRFRHCGRTLLWKAAVAGSVLAFSFIAQTLGIQYTSASNAAFITGLCVVLVPIIVTVLDRKPPGPVKIAAIATAFAGLGLLTLKDGFRIGTGDLWLLACALGFAVHLVMMNRFITGLDTLPFTAVQLFVISAVAGTVGLLKNGAVVPPGDAVVWRGVIFCAVFASAYVYAVQSHFQRYISEIKAAIIFALEPLFAAFAAYVYLGEQLTARAALGGAMILVGAILVDVKFYKAGTAGRESARRNEQA